jgi:glyoxylase-like metal-dependent hydrolase (beta-lactamase superfamily II)
VLVTPSDGPRVLIDGDAVYSEAALITRTIDGAGVDPDRARASIDRLREICREAPTVVAPTHDKPPLEAVLREFEHDAYVLARAGRPAPDLQRLRSELGMER